MTINVPTEEQEQIALMKWAKLQEPTYPELRLLFHIPNGGKRGAREAAIFKAAGVKAGVPDLFLPVANSKFNGLFIELKRLKNSKLTPAQMRWGNDLARQGYASLVCLGWQEAADVILRYLDER